MKKTALITGGSSGIGAAAAIALAQKGYNIAIGCHSQGSIERGGADIAEKCRAFGIEAECVVADVADFFAAKNLVEETVRLFGGVDILINSAGITRDGLIARMSEEQWDNVLDANLKGAFNIIRHVTPLMIKKRFGKIINITSVAGVYGNKGQANYSASKAGMIGLTKSVAKELGGRGITCNAIAPGFIETAMTGSLPQAAREVILSATCLGRIGTPEEIAHAVIFLAENDFITGQVIVVDGGLIM